MDFHFIPGKGLYEGTHEEHSDLSLPISEFNPEVTEIKCYRNMKTEEERKKYGVHVTDLDGNSLGVKYWDSFSSISYYRSYGVPDAFLTSRNRSLLEYKLQQETAKIEPEVISVCPLGLYQTNTGSLIFNLYGTIISNEEDATEQFESQCQYHLKNSMHNMSPESLWLEQGKEFINFFPGVTEILYYGALLGAVKPFLVLLQYPPDFMFSIVGKSGTLKSSMVRKYALWSDHPHEQEINFQSSMRMPEILSRIDSLEGMNFLMDDLHNVYGSQAKNQLRDRLDKLVRHICDYPKCANLFITGEGLKDMAIFSAYDRMLQITIPSVTNEQLSQLKEKMSYLPDSFMAQIVTKFVRKLVSAYDSVQTDIHSFFKQYKPFGFEDPSTRIARHIQILRLVEYLYRVYMCEGSSDFSCKCEFEKALKRNAILQQNALLHQRKSGEDIDYVKAVYECLSQDDMYVTIITNANTYFPAPDNCFLENDYIYITSAALISGLTDYLKVSVKLNEITRALKNAGILDTDSDTLTKKKFGKRHYVINMRLLEKAYESIPDFLK